jgi:hypothetical protein
MLCRERQVQMRTVPLTQGHLSEQRERSATGSVTHNAIDLRVWSERTRQSSPPWRRALSGIALHAREASAWTSGPVRRSASPCDPGTGRSTCRKQSDPRTRLMELPPVSAVRSCACSAGAISPRGGIPSPVPASGTSTTERAMTNRSVSAWPPSWTTGAVMRSTAARCATRERRHAQ